MFHVKHSFIVQPYTRSWFNEVAKQSEKYETSLNEYADKLIWWNKKVNLVSRDVSRETLMNHIRHSLLLSKLEGYKKANTIVDTGTGGGLPGIPLSIINPEKSFLLNDIVQKKINTINQIKRDLKLSNVQTKACSIAEVPISNFDLIISKHAFKINDLLSFVGDDWEEIILLKGREFDDELEGVSCPLSIQVFDLFEESQNPFYNGKAILSIKKSR